MRAWHLLALRAASKQPLRYHPPAAGPLFLPSWLPGTDREILVTFYEQIASEHPLRRVEVDWHHSLLRADQRFLQTTLNRHGAEEHLVVVRVRKENVDLQEILRQPMLQAFERLVIAADSPVRNDHLGGLLALSNFVRAQIEELYEELAEELDLRRDGVALVSTLVQSLVNPILIVDVFNALVDVQAEELRAEEQQQAVHQRVIGQLLDRLPGVELVGLAGVLLGWPHALSRELGPARQAAEEALRARALLLDGRLNRWARWLIDPSFRGVLTERLEQRAAPSLIPGVLAAARALRLPNTPDAIQTIQSIHRVWRLLAEGRTERAEEELAALEQGIHAQEIPAQALGEYHQAAGWLHLKRGRVSHANAELRKGLDLLSSASPARQALGVELLAQSFVRGQPETKAESPPTSPPIAAVNAQEQERRRVALRRGLGILSSVSPVKQALVLELLARSLIEAPSETSAQMPGMLGKILRAMGQEAEADELERQQ